MSSLPLYCCWYLVGLTLFSGLRNVTGESTFGTYETNCSSLMMGQFMCPSPEIDPLTQQPKGCTQNSTVKGNSENSCLLPLSFLLWIPLFSNVYSCGRNIVPWKRKQHVHQRTSLLVDEWILIWNIVAAIHFPRNVWSGPVLPGLPCSWTFQIMHIGLHVSWTNCWYYINSYPNGYSSRWISLCYQLFRPQISSFKSR